MSRPRTGVARIQEQRLGPDLRRYLAEWRPDLDDGSAPPEAAEHLETTDPAEALSWARARARVVLVARETAGGGVGPFSAGEEAPPWFPHLARLDERAMLAGEPAPAHESFAWSGSSVESGEDVPDDDDWSSARTTSVGLEPLFTSGRDFPGTWRERMDAALSELQGSRPTMQELRDVFEVHGILVGDDELGLGRKLDVELTALFDHRSREEVVAYFLTTLRDGRIEELLIVQHERTLSFDP